MPPTPTDIAGFTPNRAEVPERILRTREERLPNVEAGMPFPGDGTLLRNYFRGGNDFIEFVAAADGLRRLHRTEYALRSDFGRPFVHIDLRGDAFERSGRFAEYHVTCPPFERRSLYLYFRDAYLFIEIGDFADIYFPHRRRRTVMGAQFDHRRPLVITAPETAVEDFRKAFH